MKLDAFYLMVIPSPVSRQLDQAAGDPEHADCEKAATESKLPSMDLLIQHAAIDSDDIDGGMKAIEAQKGFRTWLPKERDQARLGLIRLSMALSGSATVPNELLYGLMKLARSLKGLNGVDLGKVVPQEHVARLRSHQLEYANKLATEITNLCEQALSVAFAAVGLPPTGAPVPTDVP